MKKNRAAIYTTLSPDEIRTAVQKEARKLFLKYGIEKTQMKNIAESVGIGRSTLYRYYAEKEQLAFIVTRQTLEEISRNALKKTSADGIKNGFDRLKLYLEESVKLYSSNMKILKYYVEFDLLFEGKYPEYPEAKEFVNVMKNISGLTTQFIIQGIKDGSIITDEDPVLLAGILSNSILCTAQRVLPRSKHYREEHGSTGEDMVNKLLVLLLDTIKA